MTTPFTHRGPDQLGRETWTVALSEEIVRNIRTVSDNHGGAGVLLTWDPRGHQIAPLDPPEVEGLYRILRDHVPTITPEMARACARAIANAVDLTDPGVVDYLTTPGR